MLVKLVSVKFASRSSYALAVVLTVVGAVLAADPPADPPAATTPAAPPAVVVPDAATAAIKAAFPKAEIGSATVAKELGLHVYNIDLSEETGAYSATVTPEGVVVCSTESSGPSELPEGVAKAALPEGYNFNFANKVTQRADLPADKPKFEKLDKPNIVYEVSVGKDEQDFVIQIDEAGKVILPLMSIVKAAASVPAEKFVLRVNCGADLDYTDKSGITWLADREYKEGQTKWGAVGGKTGQRTGLRIVGTDAPGVYDCERNRGTYRFDLPNGKYTVRMHNCESWQKAKEAGIRTFALKANGKVVIESTDPVKEAGFIKPLVKEVKDVEVTDGKLLLELQPLRTDIDQFPFVNAYEIIQQ